MQLNLQSFALQLVKVCFDRLVERGLIGSASMQHVLHPTSTRYSGQLLVDGRRGNLVLSESDGQIPHHVEFVLVNVRIACCMSEPFYATRDNCNMLSCANFSIADVQLACGFLALPMVSSIGKVIVGEPRK